MVSEPDSKSGHQPGAKESNTKLLHLKLTDVAPSNTNPRLNLEKDPFVELKKSILENGLLQPIVVRPSPKSAGAYEIIGGHRRFQAVSELAAEHPNDKRFTRIAALSKDVDDQLVPVLQLAENINRSDLSAMEIADGIVKALDGGIAPERLAEQLGWTRRNLSRYVQLHDAPAWLKEMAREVKVTKKKLDVAGKPVIDEKTDKPVLETDKYPGLAFTYVIELVTLYNLLHDHDCLQLEELGGDNFKPQAERVVRRLATQAAIEGWSTAKLRAEIKRAKDPKSPQHSSAQSSAHASGPPAETRPADAPALMLRDKKLVLDMNIAQELPTDALGALANELTRMLKELGFKKTVVAI